MSRNMLTRWSHSSGAMMPAVETSERCIYRWPSARARSWVDSLLVRARHDPNVLAIVAIGSAVRKGVASDDLDLIVICDDVQLFRERAPIEVDLRAFNAVDVDAKVAQGHDLLAWSIQFGRALLDRDGMWRELLKRWRTRVPLPDPNAARTRAEAARKRMDEMREMGDVGAAIELEVTYQTHCAHAVLAEAGVYPASRPELPRQLRSVRADRLADQVTAALAARTRLRSEPISA